MNKPISTKALDAARKEAARNVPEPKIEPAAGFVIFGIIGFCTVAVFVMLSYFFSTQTAWIGTSAVTAFFGWLNFHIQRKAHLKEFKELLELYGDDPRYRD